MIDTIRVKSNISDFNRKKVKMYDHFDKGIMVYEVFRYDLNLPSSNRTIAVFISHNDIKIEFSVPKFLFGHNLFVATFDDIVPALEQIKTVLEDEIDAVFPLSVEDWTVQRIDVCDLIECSNINSTLGYLQNSSYPRQTIHVYKTSVMFVGRTYTTKFYKKYDEFMKNDFKLLREQDYGLAVQLANSVRNSLRFEVGYKREFLVRYLNLHDKVVKIKNLLKYSDKLLKHFEMIRSKFYLNTDIILENSTDESIIHTFVKKLGKKKGTALFDFYKKYFSSRESRAMLKEEYSKNTFYKYKKLMEELIVKTSTNKPLCFAQPYKVGDRTVRTKKFEQWELEQYIENDV